MSPERLALERVLAEGERPQAELRARRFVALAVGLMSGIVALIWAFTLTPDDVPGSYAKVLGGVIAVPALMAFGAPWMSARWLRVVMAVIAAAALVLALALLADALAGVPIEGRSVWPLSVTSIATTAALVAGGLWPALAALAVLTAVMQGVRLATVGAEFAWLVNDAQALLTSLVVLVLIAAFLRAARDLDRAVADAMHAEATRASAFGRRAAAQRAQALVHDEVLSTLLLAAQGKLRDAVAEQAGRVLERIRAFERRLLDAPMSRSAFLSRLERITARVAPDAVFNADVPGGAPIEARAADAFAGAVEQALVNSVQHAGGAARWVTVGGDADIVRVVVGDDGPGFERDAIAGNRLGITTSIEGRMHAVGGRASIDSAPGRGTSVRLEWVPVEPVGLESDPELSPGTARGVRALVVGFSFFQILMAVIIAAGTNAHIASFVALSGMLAGLTFMGWRDVRHIPFFRACVAAVVTVIAAGTATALAAGPHGFVAAWALTAGAFVLVAVAVRGRPFVALAGLAGLVVSGIVIAVLGGFAPAAAVAVVGRPLIVVLVATTATLQLRHLRDRTAKARAEQIVILRHTASAFAARTELRTRAEELDELVGPTLERLHHEEWSESLGAECAALEGRLRDRYRGGRLVREPLIASAAQARLRGVDVVLLDDGGERDPGEARLDAIAVWMAERLDSLEQGRFTGRFLPAGRGPEASAVLGDRFVVFDE